MNFIKTVFFNKPRKKLDFGFVFGGRNEENRIDLLFLNHVFFGTSNFKRIFFLDFGILGSILERGILLPRRCF